MNKLYPNAVARRVWQITPQLLNSWGVKGLILDIDNTLTADRSQELPDEVAGWLAQMKEAGIGLTIVSNGAEKRVRPFAEKLGLAYLYRSAKPLPFALADVYRLGQMFVHAGFLALLHILKEGVGGHESDVG